MGELKVCEINQLLILLNTLGYLERRRLEWIESLLPDLKMVKLVGDSCSKVTLHYK